MCEGLWHKEFKNNFPKTEKTFKKIDDNQIEDVIYY